MADHSVQKTDSFWDRPLLPSVRVTWWMVAYLGVIAFAVLTRFWDLGSRAYSHDESIHAWESWKLYTGQGYVHNPVYHGPFLYHITALVFALFGDNDVTGRVATSLAGVLIALSPLALYRWLGKRGTLAAMLIIAISPVMMYRSRFIRHDHWTVVFNLVLFVAILYYLRERKEHWLYWAAAAIALGFAGKETTFITYFIFGTFLAVLFLYQIIERWNVPDRLRAWSCLPVFDLLIVIGTLILPTATPIPVSLLGRDPIDYGPSGIVFTGAILLVMIAISAVIGMLWDRRRWLICAAVYYGIFLPLFTSMFTNGQGIATGLVGQLGYWLSQHDVQRGSQPWYYYLVLTLMYEFLPLLVGGGGAIYYLSGVLGLRRERETPPDPEKGDALDEVVDERPAKDGDISQRIFVPFLIYWVVLALVIYSWAGEKMPWLMMQIVPPLHLLAGWTIGRVLETDWKRVRAARGLWLLLLVPLFLYTLARLVGTRPYTGTTTEELNRSMVWLASFAVGLILLVPISSILRRLSMSDSRRMVVLSVTTVLMALTLRFAWMATFINAALPTELLVYAQGAPDTALVTRELENLSRQLTGGLHLRVAYDDQSSWPFVWYLRNFTNSQFYGNSPAGPFDAEAVIVGPENEAAVKPLLGNRYYRRQHTLIWWPNQDWYMDRSPADLWTDLRDPTARRELWDMLFYRRGQPPLTSWPYVSNFALYLRRDTVQQLWEYGPDALAAAAPLPGDEYVERWQPRTAVDAWGSWGFEPGQFAAPRGMALDVEGNLYVADSQNHRIQVFDADGAFVREWGGEGDAPGQFNEPWGVAVSPKGEVYVADTWNHRIQVYSAEGEYLRGWGMFGQVQNVTESGDLFYGPRDLLFDAEGNLYVADTGNKRVIKYDADDNMVAAAGGEGQGDGQLQEPVGLALGPEGDIYVADTWNRRVQVFAPDLVYRRQWPVYAWEGVSISNKPYIAVDAEGHVYVTDPDMFRVLEYDNDGELLRTWGQYGTDLSSMNGPTGIVIGDEQRILVSDALNHRILRFTDE
ncbi:MAG TPA: TIGR03663 family protein [Chloroflexi bacterium]|nr:TIGR03663 family protein [Chloroflexota bacterium]